MRGLDITDEGQLEFSEVVRRKAAHFLRSPSKVASLAFARACSARRRKSSVREARRSVKSNMHHKGREPISGRTTGSVSQRCGYMRFFFLAMQRFWEIF
jgi:hypothetical protein